MLPPTETGYLFPRDLHDRSAVPEMRQSEQALKEKAASLCKGSAKITIPVFEAFRKVIFSAETGETV
ncbi:hypothetical protein BSNK01_19640 [Bacillaceae bacterium]